MYLSIIMPVWNESATLAQMLQKVHDLPWPFEYELILVNDGSTDNSLEIAKEAGKMFTHFTLLDNPKNMGKSQTVRRGILASKGDLVIIQDADLELDPSDMLKLVEKMEKEDLDIVYGDRFKRPEVRKLNVNFIGNRAISFISNIFTYLNARAWIPDMEVCYKLMKGQMAREVAEKLTATSNFGIEPEITARLAKYRINGRRPKWGFVPVYYKPRSAQQGKKLKVFSDGFKAIKEIVYYNLFAK